MRKRIIVVGASFAGLTTAIELAKRTNGAHDILVLSDTSDFVFLPSLIWVPFDRRRREDITFSLLPVLARHGISFRPMHVETIDLRGRTLTAGNERIGFDVLVLATGAKPDFACIPGLGPNEGYTQSILDLESAEAAGVAFRRLVEAPGPVVIGVAQGGSSFALAYELILNLARELRERGLVGRAPLTYISPEPFLGHLGVDGVGRSRTVVEGLFVDAHVESVLDASITRVEPGAVHLASGVILPFVFAMIAPPLVGVDVVRPLTEIVDASGFVRIEDTYQTKMFENVFAAGAAVAQAPSRRTRAPCGSPRTGHITEAMGKVVAYNIAALLAGQPLIERPPASIDAKEILDAGDSGIIITADRQLEPRSHAWLLPGPEGHWAKIAFEKYFMLTRSHGLI